MCIFYFDLINQQLKKKERKYLKRQINLKTFLNFSFFISMFKFVIGPRENYKKEDSTKRFQKKIRWHSVMRSLLFCGIVCFTVQYYVLLYT